MKARLLCILILCANTLFGQNDSSEITITSDQDWRIVSSNSENGFAYYFNPDKIWKKGSLYCLSPLNDWTKIVNQFSHLNLGLCPADNAGSFL